MFSSEKEMSIKFERFLKNNYGNSYIKEYCGLFGIPDFVFYIKDQQQTSIISFELKLKDWKTAAKQAFRYKSFSNISYVVLPSNNKTAAINNIEMFKRYQIGLATFDFHSNFQIMYKPQITEPYSKGLNEKILNSISSSRKRARNTLALI